MKKTMVFFISILLIILLAGKEKISYFLNNSFIESSYSMNDIPDYSNKKYIYLNDNTPLFAEEDYSKDAFESYSKLDYLKRCGVAFALIDESLMPTKERESIGMIKPSGWKTVKYDIVDGKYLYNRCHLIGYQLTGENANPNNLITCTRNMNSKIMLKFENEVANYIKKTNDKVLYRVTPVFEGNNLLAKGVIIEASSVKDFGKSLSFNVFIYNVQDGIEINYENGDSKLSN